MDAQFLPKLLGTSLYIRSVATSNMKLIGAFLIKLWSAQAFSSYFHKMTTSGHFGFPISGLIIPGHILMSDKNPRGNVTKTPSGAPSCVLVTFILGFLSDIIICSAFSVH